MIRLRSTIRSPYFDLKSDRVSFDDLVAPFLPSRDLPSFNLSLNCIMFTVLMLVSQTRFNFEKKAIFDIMSSLSFLVYVPIGFLLVQTSTILNTYFYPFFLSDMELHLFLPLLSIGDQPYICVANTYPLHLSLPLQPRDGTTTYFCLFVP